MVFCCGREALWSNESVVGDWGVVCGLERGLGTGGWLWTGAEYVDCRLAVDCGGVCGLGRSLWTVGWLWTVARTRTAWYEDGSYTDRDEQRSPPLDCSCCPGAAPGSFGIRVDQHRRLLFLLFSVAADGCPV